jgi:hypothetical protein
MTISRLFISFAKVIAICLFIFISPGCTAQTEQTILPTFPSDTPLPVFIIGEWLSKEVITGDSNLSAFQYRVIFETESQVRYIVIYPESGTEGYTFAYSFISQDSIYVDNERIIGGETWLLERKGDELVVHRTADNKTTIIVLERIK